MGILYLDEAGNTGLWDKNQPKLIYGGIYASRANWIGLNDAMSKTQYKYKHMIFDRFKNAITMEQLETNIRFFSEFKLHATEIVNQTGLWGKIDNSEKFQVLEDVVDLLVNNNAQVFVAVLDKLPLRPVKKPKHNEYIEYRHLLPKFFTFADRILPHEYSVILDDGDVPEKDVFREVLRIGSYKALPELIIEKSARFPLLQAADIVVWVTQAYHRLEISREDHHAEMVRKLHSDLRIIRHEITI